jgi:hypothetical protein
VCPPSLRTIHAIYIDVVGEENCRVSELWDMQPTPIAARNGLPSKVSLRPFLARPRSTFGAHIRCSQPYHPLDVRNPTGLTKVWATSVDGTADATSTVQVSWLNSIWPFIEPELPQLLACFAFTAVSVLCFVFVAPALGNGEASNIQEKGGEGGVMLPACLPVSLFPQTSSQWLWLTCPVTLPQWWM